MDSVVQAIVKKFLERSELGQKKYGVTLDRTDLAPYEWIQHAQEELMDGILYLEKLKQVFTPEKTESATELSADDYSEEIITPEDCQDAASQPHPSHE